MEGAHSLINRVFSRTRSAGLDHFGEKAGLFVIQRNGHSTTPFSFHSIGYWAGCHGVPVYPLCLSRRGWAGRGPDPAGWTGVAAPTVTPGEERPNLHLDTNSLKLRIPQATSRGAPARFPR